MNNWWKAGLLGAGALGLSALTGGAAAGPLASLLGAGGEVGATAGGAALAEGGTAAATGAEAASAAAAASPTAFVTAPVTSGLLGGGELSGTLAGTDMAYGGTTALAEAPSAAPSMMQQAADYAKMGGKAASAYGTVQGGMSAQQGPRPAPSPQPIYQGPAPSISAPAQGLLGNPQQNQFVAMLLAQRQRGMLG